MGGGFQAWVTHLAGGSEGAIDVKEADGAFDGTVGEGGIYTPRFSHDGDMVGLNGYVADSEMAKVVRDINGLYAAHQLFVVN